MKKIIALIIALVLTLTATAVFADTIRIGVPDDTTNEARALQLLADNGIIALKEGAGDHYAPWLPELLSDEDAAADVEYLLQNGRQQNYRNVYYLLRNMQERDV